MANTKSAIKRIRRISKQTDVNKARKSKYKNVLKKMNVLIEGKKKSEALKFLPKLNSELMKVAKTGFEMYRDRQTEEQMAAEQAAMFGGDVIDLGIYQDPSAFVTYQAQNTISPIQTLQPMATYTKPMASWAQQFMQMPQ